MSELEELPSWAGRSTEGNEAAAEAAVQASTLEASAAHPVVQQRRRRWKGLLLVLAGILALLGVGALGFFLADSQDSSETETAAEGSTEDDVATGEDATVDSQLGSEEVVTEDAEAGTADAEAPADDAAEDGQTVTVDVDEETDAATDEAADADDEDGSTTDAETDATEGSDSGRQAFFRGGKVYLTGPVSSEEIGQAIEAKAAAVVGPDNVVNEYVIDPTATIEPGSSAPLYVEDVVLFEFNSISVAEPFLPILDLGTLLLSQNPQATITVVTRTDAVGSEEVNLDVATKRAQAVINYWIEKGVSPDQIKADPRGEEGASESDDEETAALNRRAEFIITGLLD